MCSLFFFGESLNKIKFGSNRNRRNKREKMDFFFSKMYCTNGKERKSYIEQKSTHFQFGIRALCTVEYLEHTPKLAIRFKKNLQFSLYCFMRFIFFNISSFAEALDRIV